MNHTFDWQAWGDEEAVNLTSVRRSGDVAGAVPKAFRGALTKRELIASNGAYVQQDLVFHLPVTGLDGAPNIPAALLPLKPRDKVAAADFGFTVLEASPIVVGTVWRLVCRNPIIVYDLRDKLTIKKARATATAAGTRAVEHIQPRLVGVPCRIQPEDVSQAVEHGKMGDRRTFTAMLDEIVDDVSTDDLASDDQGRTFEIVSVINAQRIGELSQIKLAIAV